jgi:hypothetical protein
MGFGGSYHAPAALPPGEVSRYPFTGDWVGPWAGLDGRGKYRSHRDSTPRTVQPVASRYTDCNMRKGVIFQNNFSFVS